MVGMAILAAGPAAQPRGGELDSPYVVSRVEVDQTAASAARARELAIVEGQRKAARRLLERLVPASHQARLPQLSDAQIADLVDSFEVNSERYSSVRYVGVLTFRFNDADVRELLGRAGVPYVETRARAYVVLPLLREGDRLRLWDDFNPWRQAWTDVPVGDGLVPLVVPLGDLADLQDITAEQAMEGDGQRIATIAERYGAAGGVVALAGPPAAGGPGVAVRVTRVDSGERTVLMEEVFARRGDEPAEGMYHRIAVDTARLIQERWKSDLTVRSEVPSSLVAHVPIASLDEWLRVRRALNEVPLVRSAEVRMLARTQAVVELRYVGDESQLRLALAQRNVVLERGEGEASWQLRLAGVTRTTVRPAVGATPQVPDAPPRAPPDAPTTPAGKP